LNLEEQDAGHVAVARVLVAAHLLSLLLQPGQPEALPPLLALLGLLRLVLRLVGAFLVVVDVSVVAIGAQQHLGFVLIGAGRGTCNGKELLHELLGRRRGIARVDEGELDLDLARDDRLLLARTARLEREPPGLLQREGVGELVLEDDVKLAHVVLAKAVLVPAADLEQQALIAHNGQVEDRVPFGVERLVDRGRGLFGVAEGEDEVLQGWRSSASGPIACNSVHTAMNCWQSWWMHSPGPKCRCGPLQRDSCPAALVSPSMSLSRGEDGRLGAP
jgi:voltage-gated potassium channel Kch